MRLLITGGGGMLGRDLASLVPDCPALTHAELDITDADEVRRALAAHMPEVVLNCAAYTDVDGAETEAAWAHEINGAGAGNVARAAAELGAWTIHVSSDYVFDGSKRTPYLESDDPHPLSRYGESKLAGEQAVRAAAPESHTIVRSAWLFGVHGPCFPATILRLAGEREQLSVVEDQVGSPTFTGHLAPALLELCQTRPRGLLHVAGGGQASWYEFAQAIVEHSGEVCEVTPSLTQDLGRPAPRPAYSALGTERPGVAPALPDWREGLAEYLALAVSRA